MTSEQREKRAERNRRYYQRRRSAESADKTGLDRLDDDAAELGRSPSPFSATAGAENFDETGLKTPEPAASSGAEELAHQDEKFSENWADTSVKTRNIQTSAHEPGVRSVSETGLLERKTPTFHGPKRLNRPNLPQVAAILLSLLLIVAITFCLVNEAYRYYVRNDPTMALLKAVVGELILLYVALLTPRRWLHRLMVRTLLVMTFGYLVWIVSMGLVLQAGGEVGRMTQINSMIDEVKRQIDDRRSQLSELTKSGWISRARKVDEQLSEDHRRLYDLRSKLVDSGGDQQSMVMGNLALLVLFRVILMFTNIVLMRNLQRIFFALQVKIGAAHSEHLEGFGKGF